MLASQLEYPVEIITKEAAVDYINIVERQAEIKNERPWFSRHGPDIEEITIYDSALTAYHSQD